MKKCGNRNCRKHIDIKNGEKYITLDISLEFGSLDKIKITSSDPKGYLGRLKKGLITSLGIKTNARSKNKKNSRYASSNFIMKDLSKIIKDFDNFHSKIYVWKIPKHEPTDGCFI